MIEVADLAIERASKLHEIYIGVVENELSNLEYLLRVLILYINNVCQ